MRKLGWIYLALYVCDAALTVIASFVQSWAAYSNLLSVGVILSSVLVVILSASKRLQPRWLFLLLSLSYLLVAVVGGLVFGVLLALNVGPEAIPSNITPEFMAAHLTWYWPVHWALVILLSTFALLGVKFFINAAEGAEQVAPADAASRRG